MAGTTNHHVGDAAIERAASQEDVLVGDQIVRHKMSSRVIHWLVALSFILLLITGLPIWTPIFGWMAALVGGLSVARWLHPWTGAAFMLFVLIMFVAWVRDMRLEKGDRGWFGKKMIQYFKYQEDPADDVGKYNGGQKLFFYLAVILAVVLFATGFVLWFPQYFGLGLRQWSVVIHDLSFILFTAAIVVHIYLGTAAEPGTFRSMTRGTVSLPWARLHHPRWYREVVAKHDKQA